MDINCWNALKINDLNCKCLFSSEAMIESLGVSYDELLKYRHFNFPDANSSKMNQII